jgi:stage II sporulation protein D
VTASTPASAPAPANAPVLRLGRTQEDGRARVEPIDLESYVSQVVTGESDPRAPDAAREALAITVRTYALANRGRHKVDGFDLCDTTHCQVVRAASAPAQRAARATAGRVLLARGRVASGFHSAWCGGHPEPASDVWPGTPDDVRAVGRDDACAGEPGWSAELRAADLERAFAAAGMRGSTLRSLRVSARTSTGRTLRVHVEGFSPSELSGQEFRTAVGRTLGWQHVKSTLFELERTASGYRVRGAGFGHGAGLCVLGAGRRAERGETVESILGFYFPGLSIGFAPHATAGGEVELALPADETSQRERVLSLVQRARAEIASRAGVPPIPLRLTVHPTVESFSRATGQPWFVAGATRGSTIDLLPTTVLRRDGQLERVIRHEIAHALVDGALEGRPLWVREGAAAYFSANASRTTGAPEGPQPRRGSSAPACPSDAELRRPQSPAAQRDAYARAAACFSSAMAGGARWQSVGSGAAPRRDAGSGAP